MWPFKIEVTYLKNIYDIKHNYLYMFFFFFSFLIQT